MARVTLSKLSYEGLMTARTVAETFITYWSVQDVPRAVAVLSEDCVLTMNIAQTLLPFAGEKRGRDEIEAAFHGILADWDYVQFEFTILSAAANLVRCRTQYIYRHRGSGLDLAGTSRVNLTVRLSNAVCQICRIDEYHDAAMVEAFMRLLNLN